MSKARIGEMKFLIAGFGSIGRRHFHNLKALGEQDILFYRTGKSSLPTDELAGYVIENNIYAALAHKPDAVIVANPTAFHLDVAIPAAEVGCHLLIEKPVSNSLSHIKDLQITTKENHCRVLVGFQFRFHPTLQKAHTLLSSGVLGKPLSARAHWGEYFPDWHPWEDYRQSYGARKDLGGGVVLTLCHPFDYLRWLLGEAISVIGTTRRSGRLEINVEDQADVELDFESGVQASVHLDYLEKPVSHWFEVICSKGKMHWNATDGILHITYSDRYAEEQYSIPHGFERNDMFLAQMCHFVQIVEGIAEPQCTLDDGVKALEIALAVHASAKEGKKITL